MSREVLWVSVQEAIIVVGARAKCLFVGELGLSGSPSTTSPVLLEPPRPGIRPDEELHAAGLCGSYGWPGGRSEPNLEQTGHPARPKLAFKGLPIPPNRGHKALNRGTWGGCRIHSFGRAVVSVGVRCCALPT